MMKKLEPREYALYLLKLRDRSIGEIERKMKEKSFDSEVVAETISYLISKNFLNDKRFAYNFVRQRISGKPHGKRWFEQKLYEKRVNKDIINEALADFTSSEAINVAIERWLQKHPRAEINDFYAKLAPYLVRQGFDYEEVKDAINRINK